MMLLDCFVILCSDTSVASDQTVRLQSSILLRLLGSDVKKNGTISKECQ